jgi:hypothetical protein
MLAAEKIISRIGITGVGWEAGSASVSQERRMLPIASCHILGTLLRLVSVVGWLVGRSALDVCPIVQVANRLQLISRSGQAEVQHPTRPGLTDSTSLLQLPHDIGSPTHAHTHNPTFFLHVGQQGVRQTGRHVRRRGVSLRSGSSHTQRMCDPVHEKMAFWFSSMISATYLIPQRLFRYDRTLVTPTVRGYCTAPDFRIPLPASCIQQRHASACRPNERSVGPPAEQAGETYIPSHAIHITALLKHSIDSISHTGPPAASSARTVVLADLRR